jgi:DNA-binding GntR family transcriptional regulator
VGPPLVSHETYPDRAGPDIARRLHIDAGEVMRTDYVSYANDDPMMLVHSYEPRAITRTPIERPEEGPLLGAGLVERFTSIGMRPTAVAERLRCRMPRPSEVEALQLRPGTPIVIITRTTYHGETVLETADLMLDAHHYDLEYVTTVAAVPGDPT